MIAVNAAQWWGPIGWLYRNCPGNLAAGFLQVGLGGALGFMFRDRIKARVHSHIAGVLAEHHRGLHDKLDAITRHLGLDDQ